MEGSNIVEPSDANSEETTPPDEPPRKSWSDIVFEKFVIALLTASTLGLVNHLFWQRQERAQKQDFYFQEKTKVYSLVSSHLTELIIDVNARIEQAKADPQDKSTALAQLDAKIDEDLVQLSVQLSYVKVYFRADALQKSDECRGLIARIDRDSREFLTPQSELGRCAQGLADLLATETRQEFADFSSK